MHILLGQVTHICSACARSEAIFQCWVETVLETESPDITLQTWSATMLTSYSKLPQTLTPKISHYTSF